EFCHCHPINLPPYPEAYKKWVEMADVIRCQQKATGTVGVLTPKYVNTCNTAKYQSHQPLASAIDGSLHFWVSSVSRLGRGRKVIFFRLIEFLNVVSCCWFQTSCSVRVYETEESFHGRQGTLSADRLFFSFRFRSMAR